MPRWSLKPEFQPATTKSAFLETMSSLLRRSSLSIGTSAYRAAHGDSLTGGFAGGIT